MRKISYYALFVFLVYTAFSCKNSVELVKRRYNHGYYVAKHHSKTVSGKTEELTYHSKEKTEVAPTKSLHKMNQEEAKLMVAKTQPRPTLLSIEKSNKNESKTMRGVVASSGRSNDSPVTLNKSDQNHSETIVISKKENKLTERSSSSDDDVMKVLLIILAFFLPPLAVYLKDDSTSKWFWITFILCVFALFGWAWVFVFYYFPQLLWLAAVIIAILRIFDKI